MISGSSVDSTTPISINTDTMVDLLNDDDICGPTQKQFQQITKYNHDL